MMKKMILLCFAVILAGTLSAQKVALKNNLLYDATLTPNLALEIGLGKKTTLELGGAYNPWEFDDGMQWKHWLAQPEFRYWFCERFNGTFMGIHALGGEYSLAQFKLPFNFFSDLEHNRYEGYFYGGGISIGHQWILSKHWSIEATVGGGYLRFHYDKYPSPGCGPSIETGDRDYWGLTKAGVSLVFFL